MATINMFLALKNYNSIKYFPWPSGIVKYGHEPYKEGLYHI